MICEDAWEAGPAALARQTGAELLLIPNASPYRDNKLADRQALFADRYAEPACHGLLQPGGRPGRTGIRRPLHADGSRGEVSARSLVRGGPAAG